MKSPERDTLSPRERAIGPSCCYSLTLRYTTAFCFLPTAYLSVKAATPGRVRPERNSSEAPPPVEI
jgi:hypothetical protein